MRKRVFTVLLLAMACAYAGPASAAATTKKAACPKGQVMSKGACVAACPTKGIIAQPEACECPAGFGKILHGGGGAECQRLECPTGTAIEAAANCDCPSGYAKKSVKRGQSQCVLVKAKGAGEQKAPAAKSKAKA
jgi:hypothetical protein